MLDLIVLGGGWAGTAAALAARSAGLSVVLVESGERWAREVVEAALAEDLAARPLARASAERWAEAFRRAVRRAGETAAADRDRRGRLLAHRGVDRVTGHGRLTGAEGEVDVTIAHGGSGSGPLRARHVLVATGSRAALDAHDDRAQLLDEPAPPATALVAGGGREGVVLAALLACAGTRVTVVERAARVLPTADRDVSAASARALAAVGAEVVTGADVEAVALAGPARRVTFRRHGEAEAVVATVDRVLVATGRAARWDGVTADPALVPSLPMPPQRYRTATPWLHVAGSASGRDPWPEASQREGRAVVAELRGGRHHVPYPCVPRVVAGAAGGGWVGLSEADCASHGHAILVGRAGLPGHGAAPAGFVKAIADAGSRRLLGVHAAGVRAREAVVLGALALEAGLGLGDLAELTLPAGSAGESLLTALESATAP